MSHSPPDCYYTLIWSESLRATEAVVQRCSVKKVFLEISQNSQENTCTGVSFLIKLQALGLTLLKKRLWHRFFPVNFVKFLRTLYFTEYLWWLLLETLLWCSSISYLNVPLMFCRLFAGRKQIEVIYNIDKQAIAKLEIT